MTKKLHWYNWTSIGMHLLLLLAMVEIQLSPKEMPLQESYEVDIITDVPNAARPAPDAGKALPVNTRKSQAPKALDAIQKEKALPDSHPELMPSKIEPPRQEEQEYEPPVQPRAVTPPRTAAQPVAGPGRLGNATNEQAQWTSRVQALAWRYWTPPSGITLDDDTLKTTITLQVSKNGDLMSSSIVLSSGNKPYDRTVLLALSSLKRLPPPPAVLLEGKDSFMATMSFKVPKGANK